MKRLIFLGLTFLIFKVYSQSAGSTYQQKTDYINIEKNRIYSVYSKADSLTKDSIIKSTRYFLFNILKNEILPSWYGTPWSYEGTTRIPGKGSISCGYFITNVLSDVGFDIPRMKWAQSASEVFIKILCDNNVKRFRHVSLDNVKRYLETEGEGIYLVGLDIHVGFVVNNKDKISFIHSNYYQPRIGVMSQDITTRSPLTDSSYRVIGKLFSDNMIKNWIMNYKY